jgi:hypothetical protein
MSQLGQSRRSDRPPVASGLPPISGQFPSGLVCLKRAQQLKRRASLDHLVGGDQQRRGNGQTEALGRFQIDD